jgi:hypothetical protein
MLQLNSKNIPYQSVQVFLSLVSKFSVIATKMRVVISPKLFILYWVLKQMAKKKFLDFIWVRMKEQNSGYKF